VSSELVALVTGTAIAVGALAFVLHPLFFAVRERERHTVSDRAHADDSAIVALREIEFDRATGKLSDSDYAELRKTYGERALRDMRAEKPSVPATEPLDPIEARVRAYRMTHRECATCGVRPEPDAIYCSTCGSYLARACPDCSATITEPGAVFCSTCGASLARGRERIRQRV
jgi:predicted nucleic acid-binding Zn ribbon protein